MAGQLGVVAMEAAGQLEVVMLVVVAQHEVVEVLRQAGAALEPTSSCD